ncbi:large-conductance mechanosensitive channel protein MscL [Succinivibrio dextrinosolvens]|jgi:large conductance mechanosensitive channel|uniref:Large-conductance mechanosensitive channel n=1 Tax=Succinivibrio dextrinosolvens DSM 3072 TaxID=1123324 RepID=A0A1T4V880_9GAMM|nr:large-conductance mechanosensitive channel protein MscL [Succinivibrio dextrinosolvens]SKA61155.1 large conductance mechanosensitive channel [Succinivibrio dextrinosolvens DSM 3072]
MKDIVSTGKSFFKEFREFAVKGNVMDMAIGVVIGTAFGKIVSSLVADVIMPLVGLFVGNIDLKDLAVTLQDKTDTSPEIVLTYGVFLQNVLDFLIIAFAIFLTIKLIINLKNRIIKEEENPAEAPADPADVQLLREIRDLLKEQNK